MDLPYVGNELSMTILLADEGRFREFEDSLDDGLADRIVAGLGYRYVELDLPRFEFESQFRLSETLKSMGMPDAFDSAASDFSGMDGRSCLAGDEECLYIREVVHKAFVSVDEAGTEAAAATAVMMQVESAPPSPVSVTVDRPFIFLIRDRETGAILFVGEWRRYRLLPQPKRSRSILWNHATPTTLNGSVRTRQTRTKMAPARSRSREFRNRHRTATRSRSRSVGRWVDSRRPSRSHGRCCSSMRNWRRRR